MSGNEDRSDELEQDSLAFEYVSGTLRGEEREHFESVLSGDERLQKSVHFWEEQLMAMHSKEERPPAPQTWDNISAKINEPKHIASNDAEPGWLSRFWQWGAPTFAAVALMFVLFGYYPSVGTQEPNTDYVAVLTDDDGRALLTALTAGDNKNMWLKWEIDRFSEGTHVQLWAISKRDGETRPIAVLENTDVDKVELDEAAWRLVTDADFLILTEEEPGGSAIDEPSEMLLAKGVCVRFSPDQKAI